MIPFSPLLAFMSFSAKLRFVSLTSYGAHDIS
jgi:hypothetical protein